MLPRRTALACLARTLLVNAGVTARGMQLVGQLYVLEPALRHLYPDQERRAEAMSRYLVHSNTHPYMLPFYVGTVLSLENLIAAGALPGSTVPVVRQTLGSTLSAIGDGFFEGALLPCWSLLCVALLVGDCITLALLTTVLLFLALLAFRCCSFFYALNYGMAGLAGLKRLDLINWAGRIKFCNAVLIAVILWQLAPREAPLSPWDFGILSVTAVLAAAWIVGRWRLPRIILWLALLCTLIFMDERLLGV